MKIISNQNGFTYILALTIVMIMGIMLGMVGQSWKNIKQREQEKELIFRGSQIKEAIENWYNPKYTIPGIPPKARHPLMNLEDLLQDPYSLTKLKFIPHNYAVSLDDKNQKCAPDCAKRKISEDPMTGKEWTIIRGRYDANGVVPSPAGTQTGGIIGVASKSDEIPIKTDFKDTALENIVNLIVNTSPLLVTTASTNNNVDSLSLKSPLDTNGTESGPSTDKTVKYSNWQFIADIKNDHTKIYRAYHEGW